MKNIKIILAFLFCINFIVYPIKVLAQDLSDNTIINMIKIDKNSSKDIPLRTFKHFSPYKVTVKNINDEPLDLNYNDIKLTLDNDKQIMPALETIVYKKSKQSPVLRAFAVGIPVGVVSLGYLAIPTAAQTFALSVDANNTLKKELDKIYFKNKTLLPEEEFHFTVFVPKKDCNIKCISLF